MFRHFVLNRALHFTLLCGLIFPVLAEEAPVTEQAYLQDFPVVSSASRLSQPLSEAPSAMTVIDQQMIKASGFRTVPDLMRLVPGMYVGFADANRPVVSLHGVTDEFSRRMQILIDGRSIYLPPFGGVSWADLPIQLEDVERIEVVRGPSSASHGANSFYGVINIITREAFSQGGLGVSVAKGNATDASVRFAKAGADLDYRISIGYRADQGIDSAILNDRNTTRLINVRANYHPSSSDNVDMQLGSSNGSYGQGIVGRPEDAFRDTTASSDFQQMSWTHVWPASDETKLTFAHNLHQTLDPYLCIDKATCKGQTANPVAKGFTQQLVSSRRSEIELQNTQQISTNNRLVWGGATRLDYADYPLFLGHSYTLNPWQVFMHDEWRLTQAAILNVGTMFESDGMGNKQNSPRIALNYHVTPQHTFRLGASTATRSPVMAEVYMDAQNTVLGGAYVSPVTPLTPEKIASNELGYLGEFPEYGMTLDARVYLDKVTDMIFWDKHATYPNSVADTFKNLVSAEYRGFESTLQYRWNEGKSSLRANYAYQQATAHLGSYPTLYFSTLPDPEPLKFATVGDRVRAFYQEVLGQYSQIVPTASASLLWSQEFSDDWQFSAGYYFRGAVRVINVSPDVTNETDMKRLDFRVAKTIKFGVDQNVDLALIVQNANQDRYTKYGTLHATANVFFARRAWLTMSLKY